MKFFTGYKMVCIIASLVIIKLSLFITGGIELKIKPVLVYSLWVCELNRSAVK